MLDGDTTLVDGFLLSKETFSRLCSPKWPPLREGGRPLLTEEQDMPPAKMARRDRDGGFEDRGERDGRGSRGPRRGPGGAA